MRPRTSVVALLAVILLTSVGCRGGDGKKASGISLTFWTAEDNPDRVTATPGDRRPVRAAGQRHGQPGGDWGGSAPVPDDQRQRRRDPT